MDNEEYENKLEGYFVTIEDMSIDKCLELCKYMKYLEDNNEWYPSPHLITPYLDFVLEEQNTTDDSEKWDMLEELSDELFRYESDAYDM